MIDIQKPVREGRPGPEVYAFLNTRLGRGNDSDDHLSAITPIHNRVALVGTRFRTHLICYSHLVSGVMQGKIQFLPRQD